MPIQANSLKQLLGQIFRPWIQCALVCFARGPQGNVLKYEDLPQTLNTIVKDCGQKLKLEFSNDLLLVCVIRDPRVYRLSGLG